MILNNIVEHTPGKRDFHPAPATFSVGLGGVIAVGVVAVWLSIIYNRFLTPHEGWFSYYGLLMKNGSVPYRDFYFFTQPIHLLISRIISEFSDHLIYFRVVGAFDRIIITALYYYLLSRQFSTAAAVCGTIASSFLFLAYTSDALFSYLYTCLLFLLLALAFLHKALQSSRHRTAWMFLVGFSAALCFFTKQSNGLLAIAGLVLTLVLLSKNINETVIDVVSYFAGCLSGCLPFIIWLMWTGAWSSYVSEVFLGAASSKGGLAAVLFGFLSRQVRPISLAALAIVLICGAILLVTKKLSIDGERNSPNRISPRLTIFIASLTALLGVLGVRNVPDSLLHQMDRLIFIIVNLILYALLPIAAIVVLQRFKASGTAMYRENSVGIALLLASIYWTYGCGMSWNVAEQSAIPSLGLLLAFCYDRLKIGQTRWAAVATVAATVIITQIGIWHKWTVAFSWEGWVEKISFDGARSHWPQISDFRISRDEAAMYDAVFDDIAKHTKPGEPIVTLFTIPMFNFVGHHLQPGFAPVHYWDVCPDEVAVRDALRIKMLRPRMIVELELADWVWKEHDEGWRKGGRSGQRQLQDTINGLTSSGDYQRLRKFVTPGANMNLVVWLRTT